MSKTDDSPPDDASDHDVASFPNDVAEHLRRSGRSGEGAWHTVLVIVADQSQSRGEASDGASMMGVKSIAQSRIDAGDPFAIETVVGDRVVALFRHAGQWFAIDGMCSHQGGPLAEGVVRDGCVTCPWHGWQYDLATGIQLINRQPLQESFPVRRVDNQIQIQVR